MEIFGFNSSSFSHLFSITTSDELRKSRIITSIAEDQITTPQQPSQNIQKLPQSTIVVESFDEEDDDIILGNNQPNFSLSEEIPVQQQELRRPRSGFFDRLSAMVSIRSFNQAHQYLMNLEPTPENLSSIRTLRAFERFVIKTVRQGPSRDALLQNIENARRASTRGQVDVALKELLSVLTNIDATPKPGTDQPPSNANMFRLRRFARQQARVEPKVEIVRQLTGQVKNLVVAAANEQLKGLKVEGSYQEANCIEDHAIDLYREINRIINGELRPGSQGNLIETSLTAAKGEENSFSKSMRVSTQLETLTAQALNISQDLYDELNSITQAVRGY